MANGMRPLIIARLDKRIAREQICSSQFRHFPRSSQQIQASSTRRLVVNPVRLMRDRWWFNCARFIKKAGLQAESSREAVNDWLAPALTPPAALLMGDGITESLYALDSGVRCTTRMIRIDAELVAQDKKHFRVKQISNRALPVLRWLVKRVARYT